MFNLGQKVIVTNSSHKGKIGPKIGSVGYILGSDAARIVKRTANEISFCAEKQNVIFVRYGFGKERTESEIRKVINVFPILANYDKLRRKNIFKTFTEEIEGKSDNVWPMVKWELKGQTNVPICMMHPVENVEDIRNFNNTNFKAWYKSITRSLFFVKNVDKTRPDFKWSKYDRGAREYFGAVRDSIRDRSFREKVFDAAFSSNKIKGEIIYSVKYMQSIFTTAAINQYTVDMTQAYSNNIYNDGPFLNDLVYPAITSLIFNPSVFEINIELMRKRGLDYNRIEKSLRQTLRIMRENAQPLYSIKS